MMPNSGFSLSVTNRGLDYVIGGSGVLDMDGMASLRQATEESCKNEGATVSIDLSSVSEMQADVIAALVDTGDFCRGLGVQLTLSFSPEVLRILNDAGYNESLLPL